MNTEIAINSMAVESDKSNDIPTCSRLGSDKGLSRFRTYAGKGFKYINGCIDKWIYVVNVHTVLFYQKNKLRV